jgi:hypothetical protein
MTQLIVEVRRLRDGGWIIPRYQHAFGQAPQGILSLREEQVPDWNRHSRVARLLDQDTGAALEAVPALYDAVLLQAANSEWVITGAERAMHGLREVDCVQTWRVVPIRFL